MSFSFNTSFLGKRKIEADSGLEEPVSKRLSSRDGDCIRPSINLIRNFEEKITTSRLHYNSVTRLLKYAESQEVYEPSEAAVSALCRIFSRFLAAGELSARGNPIEADVIISQWLKTRYYEFVDLLINRLAASNYVSQRLALATLMHLVRQDNQSSHDDLLDWKRVFFRLFKILMTGKRHHKVRLEFIRDFVDPYDDLRAQTFDALSKITTSEIEEHQLSAVISVLGCFAAVPKFERPASNLYFKNPSTEGSIVHLTRVQTRTTRTAWANVFKHPLSKKQRKSLLGLLLPRISPWFPQIELLTDFLTDSFEMGGSTSLLAISGLFHLMQMKNLDYPRFYEKLYSMLDSTVLHSKHRSRYLRLLIKCLDSTHLPTALVASFIKRLSQLSLYSSPPGNVIVVPLIYNLLNNHPLLTFMVHRDAPSSQNGHADVCSKPHEFFVADTADPMKTSAGQSSVWEIKSLQFHHHPNVAMVARIISEPFFKKTYSTEDFLDHSYHTMIDAELKREMKRSPIIKYNIGKLIFTNEGGLDISSVCEASLGNMWRFVS